MSFNLIRKSQIFSINKNQNNFAVKQKGPYDYDNYDDGDVMDDLQEEKKFYKMQKTHFTDLKPDDLNEIAIAKNVDSDDDDDDEDDSSTGSLFKRDIYGVS